MAISLTIMSIDFDSFEAPVTKTFDQDEVSIGRKTNNDLVLDRAEVSPYHAKISVRKNGPDDQPHLYIKDLGSSSGTMVERDPLVPDSEIKILANQRLIIGSYLIKPNIVEDQSAKSTTSRTYKAMGSDLMDLSKLDIRANDKNLILGEEVDEEGYIKPLSITEEKKNENIISSKEQENNSAISLSEQIEVISTSSAEESNMAIVSSTTSTAEDNLGIIEAAINPIETLVTSQPKKEEIIHYEPLTKNTSPETTSVITKIMIEDSHVLDLDFTALELLNLKGKIKHKNMGLAAVLVNAGNLGKTYTDENGYFEFNNIEEGTEYQIILNKEGYTFESSALSGALEMPTELEARAIKLFGISGRIMHKGEAMAGVLVNIPGIGATTTMSDGSFKFSNIKDGTSYELKVSKDKFIFDALEGKGIIDKDINITISAKHLFNIGGKIVHKGKPISGVEVECLNVGKTTTDSNGTYSFENIAEGQECIIKASKAGFVFKQLKMH